LSPFGGPTPSDSAKRPIPKFVQVLNIDNGDIERIPASGIVELMA
jgi:hypothetical protein